MDLTKRKEELLAQKEKLEQVKKDAHQGIIAINVKLRKLESVTRDAEELFTTEHQPAQTLEIGIELLKQREQAK